MSKKRTNAFLEKQNARLIAEVISMQQELDDQKREYEKTIQDLNASYTQTYEKLNEAYHIMNHGYINANNIIKALIKNLATARLKIKDIELILARYHEEDMKSEIKSIEHYVFLLRK